MKLRIHIILAMIMILVISGCVWGEGSPESTLPNPSLKPDVESTVERAQDEPSASIGDTAAVDYVSPIETTMPTEAETIIETTLPKDAASLTEPTNPTEPTMSTDPATPTETTNTNGNVGDIPLSGETAED